MASHGRLPLDQWSFPIEFHKGTLTRRRTDPPGPTALAKGVSDIIGEFIFGDMSEEQFRCWAMMHAIEFATFQMRAYSAVAPLTSSLSDDMLRMYLRGRTPDPALIRRVGEEIRTSGGFSAIATDVGIEVDRRTRALGRALTQGELMDVARRVVRGIMHREGGFEFFGALQPVVGGISRMEVPSVSIRGSRYTVRVLIGDTYDFENDRSDEPDYDEFRRHLYDLICERRYYSFISAVELGIGGVSVGPSRVFASFMYAIERAGYTPGGVPWEVTVPFEREFHIPARTPAGT